MSRKIIYVLLILALTLSLSTTVLAQGNAAPSAQGNAKSYIVVMANDPVIAYDGSIAGYAATKPGNNEKVNPNSAHVRKYEKFLEKNHKDSLTEANVNKSAMVHDYTFALNGYSAILTDDQAEAIRMQKGVLMVLEDEMRYAETDDTPNFLGLTDPAGAWATGYTGENVVVGVIDTGIWPEHPSFADDGSYSFLPAYDGLPCEFGNTAWNPDDAPFTCNNKLLGARQMLDTYRMYYLDPDEFDSARDDGGHGTHTASTAAGNSGVDAYILGEYRGTISGMAPRARVIAYKALGNLGGFSSDLAAAIDQAVEDGVDVINYSIGSSSYSIGVDDIAFLFAADAGVFVATSNGNSGPNPATTGSPASVPWLTSVGASTHPRFFQGSVTTGDGEEYFGTSITGSTDELPLVDSADFGNELCDSTVPFTGDVSGAIVLCKRGTNARIDKGYAVYLAGGAGLILYNQFDGQDQESDTHWVPAVQIDYSDGLAIKDYIDNAASPVAQITGGQKIMVDAPDMAAFSSRGPNRLSGDIIKPDITAPGVQVLAGYSPFPDEGEVPGELFAAIAGTSMASPHIAGIFALIKQAHPEWSPAMAKSAIMTTAYQDVMKEDGATLADPFDMGAGHVNPGSPVHKGSAFQPGLVYDAGLYEYAAFTCGANLGVFTSGTCAFLESVGVPMDPSDLNLPSIGIEGLAASQTVQRTVTSVAQENGWRTYTVSVDAPAGYNVSVSPSTIRLKSGQSATYYVTVTNVSGSPDVWSHGSLTWTDETGNYSVYSPISVSGALFEAPNLVTGSGESGSAGFDVSFGYTGDYTAAPHGLVAPLLFFDEIGQDPDQTYPSADDSPVGVQKWDFSVVDAALLRIKLVIPGDDDIDLFLEDSSGKIVASSGNGGTDELIEMFFPENDTYTLVVHGWSVPNAPLPYTVSTWIVPLASGGSLSVDSAPTSAVSGTTETVNISWSGLASSTEYLGAVSHSDSSGLIGLTLVEVSVP